MIQIQFQGGQILGLNLSYLLNFICYRFHLQFLRRQAYRETLARSNLMIALLKSVLNYFAVGYFEYYNAVWLYAFEPNLKLLDRVFKHTKFYFLMFKTDFFLPRCLVGSFKKFFKIASPVDCLLQHLTPGPFLLDRATKYSLNWNDYSFFFNLSYYYCKSLNNILPCN